MVGDFQFEDDFKLGFVELQSMHFVLSNPVLSEQEKKMLSTHQYAGREPMAQ